MLQRQGRKVRWELFPGFSVQGSRNMVPESWNKRIRGEKRNRRIQELPSRDSLPANWLCLGGHWACSTIPFRSQAMYCCSALGWKGSQAIGAIVIGYIGGAAEVPGWCIAGPPSWYWDTPAVVIAVSSKLGVPDDKGRSCRAHSTSGHAYASAVHFKSSRKGAEGILVFITCGLWTQLERLQKLLECPQVEESLVLGLVGRGFFYVKFNFMLLSMCMCAWICVCVLQAPQGMSQSLFLSCWLPESQTCRLGVKVTGKYHQVLAAGSTCLLSFCNWCSTMSRLPQLQILIYNRSGIFTLPCSLTCFRLCFGFVLSEHYLVTSWAVLTLICLMHLCKWSLLCLCEACVIHILVIVELFVWLCVLTHSLLASVYREHCCGHHPLPVCRPTPGYCSLWIFLSLLTPLAHGL